MKKAARWRAVLAGCGAMSRTWVAAARCVPGLEIVGLVDLQEEAAKKLAEEQNLNSIFISQDLHQALSQTKANLLFVCTVPEAHKSNILTGLRHGCHVLTEKPLASTMAEARTIIAAAIKTKRVVAVTQNYRYRRPIRSIKKFIASGKIGRITGLDADFYLGAHFGGFRDEMEHVLLLDMSIHAFDLARFISEGTPTAVLAHEWNPTNSWYQHGASATAIFEFENGVIFNYRGSWCSQGFDTDWNGAWRILGEKGAILWDGSAKIEAQIVEKKEGFIWPKKTVPVPLLPANQFPTDHIIIMREFLRSIEKGIAPETTITDNIHSLAMVHGAITSAEKKRWIAF